MKGACAAVAAIIGLALCGVKPLHAQDVTLKVSHFLPGVALAQAGVLEPWCQELGKQSAGRIKCQFFPALQLGGTAGQLIDQVRNGVADIVWTAPSYSPGRFPKTEAVELPGVLPLGGLRGGRAIWSFYEANLRDEYGAFKVLAMHGDGGLNLHTVNQPIGGVADLAGVKLRAPNRTIARTLTALGAVPVAMPPAQMTEAIAKGVVDGASAVWEVIIPTKLDEVTRFHVETPADRPVLGATVLTVLMNKARFAALPSDLQAVIERNSGAALVERFGNAWDQAAVAARDRVLRAGHTVKVLSGEEYEAMLQRVRPVELEWLADATAKGIAGAALLASARTLSQSSNDKQ